MRRPILSALPVMWSDSPADLRRVVNRQRPTYAPYRRAGIATVLSVVCLVFQAPAARAQSSGEPIFPVDAENRGIRATVDAMSIEAAEGGDGESVAVTLDLTIENIIDPVLVFESGIDEAIRLQGYPVNGPFLVWGDEQVATIDARLPVEPTGADVRWLPDPVSLPYYGDRVSGSLLFTVQGRSPGPDAALVLPHDTFGTLSIPLVSETDTAISGTDAEGAEGADVVDLSAENLSVDADGVWVDVRGRAGRWQSGDALVQEGWQPVNLTGMRLFLDDEAPIAPVFDTEDVAGDPADTPGVSAADHAPLVYLPTNIVSHRVFFPTPLAVDARRLAVVLPVPPASPSEERYAVLPLRGEGPWLPKAVDGDETDPSDTAAGELATIGDWPVASESDESVLDVPWPEPPAIDEAWQRFADSLAERHARLAGSPGTGERYAAPSVLPPDTRIRARFDGKTDRHVWKLPPGTVVPEPGETTEAESAPSPAGSRFEELHLFSEDKRIRYRLQSSPDSEALSERQGDSLISRLVIDDTRYLVVEARGKVDYRLSRVSVDDDDPNRPGSDGRRVMTDTGHSEFEPNDTLQALASTDLLDAGSYGYGPVRLDAAARRHEIGGLFDSADDEDILVLQVSIPLLVTLEVAGSAQLTVLTAGDEQSTTMPRDRRELLADLLLLPGRNEVKVSPRGRVQKPRPWQLSVTTYPAPAATHEREPNGTLGRAQHLVPYAARTGRLPLPGDVDLYYFQWPGRATARFDVTPVDAARDAPPLTLALTRGDTRWPLRRDDRHENAIHHEASLTAGVYTLAVSTRAPSPMPYRIELVHAMHDESSSDLDEVRLSIPDLPLLKPWYPLPQRVTTTIEVDTPPAERVSLTLDSAHEDVVARIRPSSIGPGDGAAELQVQLFLRRDLRGISRFPVTLHMVDEAGRQRSVPLVFGTDVRAPARPHPWQDALLPPPLLGALDLARPELGGRSAQQALFDGVRQSVFRGNEGVVELAGDTRREVVGFLVDVDGNAHDAPATVELALSGDGQAWDTVATLDIPPYRDSIPVTLDSPTAASQVRVLLLGQENGSARGSSLLNVKVLGHDTAETPVQAGANLASDAFGLQLVRLDAREAVHATPYKRRARVESLTIVQPAWVRDRARVRLGASVHGPWGPWQDLGEIGTASDTTITTSFPEPVDLRYLKLSVEGTDAGNLQVSELREVPHSRQQPSILGEWGHEDQRAWHEWLVRDESPDPAADRSVAPSADSPATSTPGVGESLKVGDQVAGQVSYRHATQEHWRVVMPPDGSDLVLSLKGNPVFQAQVRVTGEDGRLLNPSVHRPGDGSVQLRLPAESTPDAAVVTVYDTPVHLMLVWDDSGSVAPFVPSLEQLVRNLPFEFDTDAIRLSLLPIPVEAGDILLENWSSDPHEVMAAMNRYRPSNLSTLYAALDSALDELEAVDGRRVLVILGDAQGDRDAFPENHVERRLRDINPTTFVFDAGSDAPSFRQYRDHMQNWALLTGGRYSALTEPAQATQAVQAVQGWLASPLDYTLSLSRHRERQGQLSVVSGESDSGGGNSHLHVILDASGSMWAALEDGRTRIEVARESLETLIDAGLPDDMLFSLRVFGHRAARSCRTDLEISPGPLRTETVRRKIRGIDPKDRSKTPIAASLEAVGDDLGKLPGRRTVILISDGEETCGGDPEAVIGQLIANGVDLRLNIIGLDIDDALAERFGEWARLGRGEFFRAADAPALAQALNEMVKPVFTVRDEGGTVVASGRVDGDPVTVPAGRWTLDFEDAGDDESSMPVDIRPGEMSRITR